jgi:hypothetical protein
MIKKMEKFGTRVTTEEKRVTIATGADIIGRGQILTERRTRKKKNPSIDTRELPSKRRSNRSVTLKVAAVRRFRLRDHSVCPKAR